MSEESTKLEKGGMSRRKFLKGFGLTVAGAAIGGGMVGGLSKEKKQEPEHHTEAQPEFNKALMYFTQDQFNIVAAATERIFPKDANGPGAIELNVPYYIDHQLTSGWGIGAKEYTQGPFHPGEPTQGYQGRLNRQQIFDTALKGIEEYSLKTYENSFRKLDTDQQDEVLTKLSEDKIKLKGISSSYFFNLLCSTTLEGAYSDPLYGGNRNMEGWKMKNFPGHQMSYMNIVESDEFTKIPPSSLNSQH